MDVYLKHKSDFHTLRKTEVKSGDCKSCSLRKVCEGREGLSKRIVTALCDAGGHGFKPRKDPFPKKNDWEDIPGCHPRVVVEVDNPKHGRFRIPVDVGIMELVVKLHMEGIRTRYSCQGDPGQPLSAYIDIDPEDACEKATEIICDFWKGKYVYRTNGGSTFYMSETLVEGPRGLGPVQEGSDLVGHGPNDGADTLLRVKALLDRLKQKWLYSYNRKARVSDGDLTAEIFEDTNSRLISCGVGIPGEGTLWSDSCGNHVDAMRDVLWRVAEALQRRTTR